MKKFFKKFFRYFIILLIASTVYALLCRWMMPPITVTQLTSWVTGHGLSRDYVSHDEISPYLRLAAIASEDQLFPDHGGFDWVALRKSLETNPKKKGRVRGGAASTISQQAAKNVFLWQGEGVTKYVRKAPEFYYTKMIEWFWGKRRILDVYLNVIETGPGLFGVEAAAQKYFHVSAKNVTRKQAAMIIACLPNPKKFSVSPPDKFIQWKTSWILNQMNNIQDDEDIQELIK